MSELKRCPFCGGEAEVKKCGVICDAAYIVVCKECKTRTRLSFVEKDSAEESARREAEERWNRRTGNA